MRILDPRTVFCTTIGRLLDWKGDHPWRASPTVPNAIDLTTRSFWDLSPVRALVCCAANAGTIVIERSSALSKATLTVLPISWPAVDPDGCGMVVGGDAFMAALFAELAKGAKVLDAAGAANAAFADVLGKPLGAAAAVREDLLPAAVEPTKTVENPALDRLVHVLERIDAGANPCPFLPGVVSPTGGALELALGKLTVSLETWKPRKGKDLIAIFGESRCGKEYPLDALLEKKGLIKIGPVNMHLFLHELEGWLGELTADDGKTRPQHRVLFIDEVMPGDAARSLLNLMGDKKHRPAGARPTIDFLNHPVVLMSSMDPKAMLTDLRGRLCADVLIPPLRARWPEIPYLIPVTLRRVLGGEDKERLLSCALRVSLPLLSVLLRHDWQPQPNSEAGTGLDQQNFRAFEDMLETIHRNARNKPDANAATGDLVLTEAHLPEPLKKLVFGSADAGGYLRYAPGSLLPTREVGASA
jgi:hypothetical protein